MAANVGNIEISNLEKRHLADLLALIESEGWDIDMYDLELFFKSYGQDMYGAFDSDGQLRGHLLGRLVSEHSVLIELVLVKREARGRGIGRELLGFIHAKFNQHNICLLPLAGKEGFYEKCGFHRTDIGVVKITAPIPTLSDQWQDASVEVKRVQCESDIEKVLAYKAKVHSMDVETHITNLCQSPHTIALYAEKDNVIKGFLIAKQVKTLLRLSLFYADDLATAKCLMYQCSKESNPLLKYKFAWPTKNTSNVEKLLEELHLGQENQNPVETLMTTRGDLEDFVNWDKIYGVFEATLMLFV